MRTTSSSSARLLAIGTCCTVLLCVFCSTVWTEETKKSNPRVKELQQQRLAILEEVRDTAKKLFESARAPYKDALSAEQDLIAARIAYAETRQDRIKICDEAIKNASEFHKFIQGQAQSGRASRLEELKAQAFLFETQLMRENAEAHE